MRTNEIKNEIYEMKKREQKTKRKDLKHETKKHKYHFQQYETIRSFAGSIYTRKASIVEVKEDQSNLLKNLVEINNKHRPKNKESKDKKQILTKVHMLFAKVKS